MKIYNIIAIVDEHGKPQNPLINKNGFANRMIESGEVKILCRKPILTLQIVKLTSRTRKLIFASETEKLTLGIDYGYKFVGYSIVSKDYEIIGGTLFLRNDIPKLLNSKSMYRTQRRGRLRFRKPKFEFRRRKSGWLPPSIQHDLESLVKLVRALTQILPINNIIIETATFDIQKLKNPTIEGKGYQQGERFGIDGNLREYILQRDKYSCKHSECEKKEKTILNVHHIVERNNGGTDSPDNLITLCNNCHTPANHKNGFLSPKKILGDKKLSKSFKSETYMNIIRKFILNEVSNDNPKIKVNETFGYITKERRLSAKDEGIDKTEKTHNNDAFFIAGGFYQERIDGVVNVNFLKRNNRVLETFRDAKYIDSRDGKIKSGQKLSSQRTTRSLENPPENLRQYRRGIIENNKRKEITKGNRSIRTTRYEIQKGTIIKLSEDYKKFKCGQILTIGGTQNKGRYAIVLNGDGTVMKEKNSKENMTNVLIPTKICEILKNKKGIVWRYE